ncbi:MAG: ComF family protein [Candidatus Kerfeldbacteria bacterium]
MPPIIHHLRELVLNILFPPSCRGCGTDGVWLCESCLLSCGPHIDRAEPVKHVDRLLCLGSYDSRILGQVIKQLKYGGGRVISTILGRALGKLAEEYLTADCIIPVPLHSKRQRSRGFNQAMLISEEAASVLKIPVMPLVIRIKNTVPQVTLHENERARNVAHAFALAHAVDFVPKRGIIIDDVFTTGATISEVAHVLREAGMEHITALTIAKG